MKLAIGIVELNSIAKGIETCDYMIKAAGIQLLRSSTICPGKYMIMIGGETGEVKASMETGIKRGGAHVVDTLLLPNVHPSVIPAITGTSQVPEYGAIGVLEFFSVASAVTAADIAAKAASVTLMEVHIGFAIGGKGYVTMTGDVGAVTEAVEAARRESEFLVETTIIPRPSRELFSQLL